MQRRTVPGWVRALLWTCGVIILAVWAALVLWAVLPAGATLTTCDHPTARCGPVPRP